MPGPLFEMDDDIGASVLHHVFCFLSLPFTSIYGLDSCTRTLSHIEHEKCLVRLHGYLDFCLFCLLAFIFYPNGLLFPSSSHILGMLAFLIPSSPPIYHLPDGHWPDFCPLVFFAASAIFFVLISLLEASCHIGWRTRPHPLFLVAVSWALVDDVWLFQSLFWERYSLSLGRSI